MSGVSRARSLLLRAVALLAALTAAWVFATPPAVAGPTDPIQIEVTDPVGDAKYGGKVAEPGLDIVGFSVTQDRAAKKARGTVTFAGNLTSVRENELRIAFGFENASGGCTVSGVYGWVHVRHDMGTDGADYLVAARTDIRQDVAVTRGDKVISFETPAAPSVFDGAGFRCIVVTTEKIISETTSDVDNPTDRAIGFAAKQAEVVEAVVDPGKGQPAPILDGDGDGVHDGIDQCPKVAGAATNGCESVPLAKSIKLGTKRVVIDRLLATTSGVCPKTVKVVITLKGKTYGKQALGTITKGKFCHVFAVVPLKKKIAKARVVITGTGVTSAAATVVK